jgi:hypothetical protein
LHDDGGVLCETLSVQLPVGQCPRRKTGGEAVQHPPLEVMFGNKQEAVHLAGERCARGILVSRRRAHGDESGLADERTIALVQVGAIAIGQTSALNRSANQGADARRLFLIAGIELGEVACQRGKRRA